MSAVFRVWFIIMNLLISATPIKAPNGPFWPLLSPPWDVLLNVHEEHGPNFLHDYVKFDPYLTISTTFITYHSEFAIVKNVTTLGYGCDWDLGEPPRVFSLEAVLYLSSFCEEKKKDSEAIRETPFLATFRTTLPMTSSREVVSLDISIAHNNNDAKCP